MSIQELIGKKLTKPQSKDAIHIAVAPVTASETLYPGQQIGFLHGIESDLVCATSPATPALGIVDPFLTEALAEGEKFFMFLLPNTVTGMRHEWQHPAFGATGASVEASLPEGTSINYHQQIERSVSWISDFASQMNMEYHELIDAARSYVVDGSSECLDHDSYNDVGYEQWERFWHHFGIVSGLDTDGMVGHFFRCAC